MLRSCFAGFLFLFVVLPSMCAFLTVAALNNVIFDPGFYASMIDTPALYHDADGSYEAIMQVEDDDLREILLTVFGPEQMQQMVTQFTTDSVDAVLSGYDAMPITLNLSALRDAVPGFDNTKMSKLLLVYPQILAPCVNNQPPYVDNKPLPLCIPPNETPETLALTLINNQTLIHENFPDSLTYNVPLDIGELDVSIRDIRNSFNSTLLTLAIAALVSWLVVAFVYAKYRRGRFRWLGATLAIPGVLLIIASTAFSQVLLDGIVQANTAATNRMDLAAGQAISGGVLRVGGSFLIAGLVPAIIGILLFMYGSRRYRRDAMLRSKKKKNQMAVTMPERRKKPVKRQP